MSKEELEKAVEIIDQTCAELLRDTNEKLNCGQLSKTGYYAACSDICKARRGLDDLCALAARYGYK